MAFPLLALLPAVEKLLDRILPNPEAKAAALLELRKEENAQALQEMQIELQTNKMQADINLEEARHTSIWVSGWRPAVGWCCALAFSYNYFLQPLAAFVISNYTGKAALLPAIDMEVIGWTLAGMLGLGGSMRTFEKIKGVTK